MWGTGEGGRCWIWWAFGRRRPPGGRWGVVTVIPLHRGGDGEPHLAGLGPSQVFCAPKAGNAPGQVRSGHRSLPCPQAETPAEAAWALLKAASGTAVGPGEGRWARRHGEPRGGRGGDVAWHHLPRKGRVPPRGPEDPALSLPHLLSSEQDGIAPGLFQPLALILHPPLSPASQFRGFLAFWVCEGVGRPSEKGRWRHKRGSAVVAPVWGRPHRRHLGIPGPILPSSLLSRRTPSPAGSSGPRGTHYHHLGCPGLPWERSRGSPLSPPRASAAGDVPRLRGASALCSRAPGLANCTISAASGRPVGRGGQVVGEAGSGWGRRAASPLSPTPRVLAAQPASTCAVHLIYC